MTRKNNIHHSRINATGNVHIGDILISINSIHKSIQNEKIVFLLESIKTKIKLIENLETDVAKNKLLDVIKYIESYYYCNSDIDFLKKSSIISREIENYVIDAIRKAVNNEEPQPYIWKDQNQRRFWEIEIPTNEKNPLNLEDLKRYLENDKLRNADYETSSILISFLNKKSESKPKSWISSKDLKKIPIELLYEIDQLWMYYSESKFGITSQYINWISCKKDFFKFSKSVGWIKSDGEMIDRYSEFIFEGNAPKGHFPSFYSAINFGQSKPANWSRFYLNLFTKIDNFFQNP